MIDLGVVVRFALLLVRPGMLVLVAPALGGSYAPTQIKVATTVLLALVLAPTVAVPAAANDVALTLIIAREVVIGLSLGLAVRCPACSALSVNLVSRSHVDLPFANDERIGVVEHVFADDALRTVAEFKAELHSASFDERRLHLH